MTGIAAGVLLLHTATAPGRTGLASVIERVRRDVDVTSCEMWETDTSLSARLELTGQRTARVVLPGSITRGAIEYAAPAPDVIGELHWRRSPTRLPRLAILVSTTDHCLLDLLHRHSRGELPVEIAAVVSNHRDLAAQATAAGVPFQAIDFTDRAAGCRELVAFLNAAHVDLVALARFMLILPGWVCTTYERRMVNVHHALLPAFQGARPHHQASQAGVRVHGATAHYATAELDCGAILCQEARPVLGPIPSPAELARRNRPCEARVLSTAVRLVAEQRVLIGDDGTAVLLDGPHGRHTAGSVAGVDMAVAS